MKSPPLPIKNNRIPCTKFAIRTIFAWEKQAAVQPTVNVNAACNYNCKVFAPKQCVRWTYICACTRNWVAFICSPPSHYCLIFHLCICKFLSSLWIRHHRKWKNGFDYYIQRFTPQPYPMHQFTNPSPSHLPLSSSSQMYTPLYFANSRKQRQGNTQGIWQEQCTIYCTCTAMLFKVLVLAALNSMC